MSINRTTKLADAVLANIELIIDEDANYYLEPYQNGREHGWTIAKKTLKVAFAEYRSSDQIVLYIGERTDFNMSGNVPSDKVYENKVFLPYDDTMKAAQRIIAYLEGE